MICLMLDESDLSFFRSPPFKGFPYLTLPLPCHFFSNKQQCQCRLFDFGFTQSSLFFIVCYGVTISYPNLNFSLPLVKILVTEFPKVSPLLRPVNGSDFEIRPAPPIFGGLSFPTCFLYLSRAPMKRSVRPLFSALLFAFFAASLICRVAIRRRSFSFSSAIAELGSSGLITEEIVFNETLLEFAAIDPGEPKSKQEVDLISDYDNTRRSHRRHFSSMSRPIEQQQQQRHGNRDIASKFPVTLRSPQVYRYWSEFRRNLRLWARRRAYEPNIMLDLISLVKNPIDSHNGVVSISSKRYSSCAVVGNSGTLLNSQYGGLIDKHEIVIRLNNAKTERFEKKVGSKTNISFINSNILHQCGRRESCYCHPYGETVSIVMYICQPIHVLDYTVCKPSHRAPLVITDPRFDVLCARIVKYYSVKKFLEEKRTEGFVDWSKGHEGSLFHYSSGMQAVMLAVGICEKVSVFGFGKLNSTKHHYHTNQKAELKLHDYEAEYRLYRDLENNPRAIPFLSKEFKIPLVQVYH